MTPKNNKTTHSPPKNKRSPERERISPERKHIRAAPERKQQTRIVNKPDTSKINQKRTMVTFHKDCIAIRGKRIIGDGIAAAITQKYTGTETELSAASYGARRSLACAEGRASIPVDSLERSVQRQRELGKNNERITTSNRKIG